MDGKGAYVVRKEHDGSQAYVRTSKEILNCQTDVQREKRALIKALQCIEYLPLRVQTECVASELKKMLTSRSFFSFFRQVVRVFLPVF